MLLAMKREQDEGAEGDAPPEHPSPVTQEYVDIVQVQRLLRRDRAFLPYNAHAHAHPPSTNIEDWISLWFNNTGNCKHFSEFIIIPGVTFKNLIH